MDLEKLGKFLQKYLLAGIMSVLTFLFLRDYSILFIPFLIVAILLEGSAPGLFLSFLLGVGIDLYIDGTSQQQTQMLIITGGIAFISLAIQFVQRYIIKVDRTSTTIRNSTFAMVGLAIMYIIMYSRCTDYVLPPDYVSSIPEEYIGLQVFFKVGICTADYAIGPLIGLSDLKISFNDSAMVSMVAAGDFWTKRSPCFPCWKAYNTRSTASSNDIINRVILGSVIVNGFFPFI